MLRSESDSVDMNKVMMQSLEGCSSYLNGLGVGGGSDSPSPSHVSSLPQSVNDLLGGLVNPSQLMANNMDGNSMAALLEQMASFQSQFLASQSLPFLSTQPPPSTPSEEVYCTQCDKVFANRSFLLNHQLNKHGKEEETSAKKGIEESISHLEGMEGGRNSSVIRERSSVEGTSSDREMKREEDNEGMSSIDPNELGGSTVSKCDECAFESDDLLCLIQHKATNHPKMDSELLKTLSPPSSFPCSECDHSFESAALLSNHSALVHGQFGHLLNMLGGDATFPAFLLNSQLSNPFSSLTNTPPVVKPPAKRNYTSAGKNYCDVCNKEVCNKYFLRTHMLKMHGIVIDENKPVIANIDTRERERTGELTFRCDICSTTLSNRQQLREHKSSAHNVSYPVGTPSTPSALSTPTRPIKTPSVMPSPSMVPPLTNVSLSHIDLSSLNDSSTSIDHSNSHTIIPDLMAGLPLSASVVRDTRDLNGVNAQSMSKCQHCVYTTRFARNMEYHVERHERLNDVDGVRSGMKMEIVEREEEKITDRSCDDVIMRMTTNAALQMAKTNETSSFECTKCHRSFTSQSFLNTHTNLFHSPKMMADLAVWTAHKRKMTSTKLPVNIPKRLKRGVKKNVTYKDNDVHGVERHSVTSGSISPLRSDVPEGMSICENGYSLQSVLVSTPLGCLLPSQFNARLPLSSPILSPLTLTLTLTPIIS